MAQENGVTGITDPTTGQFLLDGQVRVIDGQTVYGTVQNGDFFSENGTLLQTQSGLVEHGYTNASNQFIATKDINGQIVDGGYGSDGSFYSSDGKIYVDSHGNVEYGITDPTSGQFLPNGQTRVIDGQTVYGETQNGDFFSADGKTLQTQSGLVEHGYTNSDNQFVAQDVVNGQTLDGGYGSDGSFLSSDGTTYVDPKGAVEHGITDPASGQFLPNGETRVIDGQTVYGSVQNGDFFSENGKLLQLPSGFVEHGYTNSDNQFVAQAVVNGQTIDGAYGSDGSFLSSDGTTYIDPKGAVQHGITDPATNQFLPNGETRVINGQTVYGIVQSGDFFSEDGTLLQLPSGFIEHGYTDSSGQFWAEVTVNGQTIAGSYGTDGSFMSKDGTVYIKDGQVQYGVTDPATNEFLPGGSTYTLPSGTVLYGFADDGGFYSADGHTLVLPGGGQVVTGNLDISTGIFTASNGTGYFVGQQGIEVGTWQSDGSLKLADGSIVMTPKAWSIDLPQMEGAILLIELYQAVISTNLEAIAVSLPLVADFWMSPAGMTYVEMADVILQAMVYIDDLLETMVIRMRQTYENYVTTEATNARNLSSSTLRASGS